MSDLLTTNWNYRGRCIVADRRSIWSPESVFISYFFWEPLPWRLPRALKRHHTKAADVWRLQGGARSQCWRTHLLTWEPKWKSSYSTHATLTPFTHNILDVNLTLKNKLLLPINVGRFIRSSANNPTIRKIIHKWKTFKTVDSRRSSKFIPKSDVQCSEKLQKTQEIHLNPLSHIVCASKFTNAKKRKLIHASLCWYTHQVSVAESAGWWQHLWLESQDSWCLLDNCKHTRGGIV